MTFRPIREAFRVKTQEYLTLFDKNLHGRGYCSRKNFAVMVQSGTFADKGFGWGCTGCSPYRLPMTKSTERFAKRAQRPNRWSSERRGQTCLDYAESRQRKTKSNEGSITNVSSVKSKGAFTWTFPECRKKQALSRQSFSAPICTKRLSTLSEYIFCFDFILSPIQCRRVITRYHHTYGGRHLT